MSQVYSNLPVPDPASGYYGGRGTKVSLVCMVTRD